MRAAIAALVRPTITKDGSSRAAALNGTEDVLRRAKAYEAAGVDALFFAGGVSCEQLDAIYAEVKLPLMMGGGRDGPEREYLASRRVRIALQGHQPFSAAVQAVYNTLKALREGTKPADLPGIASTETMRRVTRDGDYRSWTEKFLGG
jgi:carboxyvinyl-carboxyphosphonate phosphorylmutase